MKISIIIPCWRDATALVKLVDRLRNASDTQWIAVLVNPDRSSVADLERKGVECLSFPRPNRGAQMNRGAQRATGDVLLFHHADSQLTVEHLESLREAMATSKAIGGAFYRKFDERHPRLRWAEPAERWRCRHWGALFGDQSLFVRKEIFMQIGRFADIPLMEDVEFSKRLRQNGLIVLLDPPMRSSPRKHLEEGSWRTTLRNFAVLVLFKLGIPPEDLHRWYYRQCAKGSILPAKISLRSRGDIQDPVT
ncbi:MAG: TIGR04283 family arsenosugar biosynthesis glycosyltransferase [Chthoniobacterales bacterium]